MKDACAAMVVTGVSLMVFVVLALWGGMVVRAEYEQRRNAKRIEHVRTSLHEMNALLEAQGRDE